MCHLASSGGAAAAERVDYQRKAVPPQRRGGYTDYWLASDVLEFTSHPNEGHMFDADGNQVDFKGPRADRQTDFVLDYLRSRDGARPWFLFLSYIEPHHQNDMRRFVAPPGYADRYRNAPVPQDLMGHEGDWKENLADYYGIIADLDDNLGRIVEELKKLDMFDNTVIIFTSDHGCHFKTRNSEYKRACHDACIRIPMVMWGPNIPKGKVVEEPVSLVDLPPTLMELASRDVPHTMRGTSLLPSAHGESTGGENQVYIEISEAGIGRALRTRRWTYCIETHDEAASLGGSSETYTEAYLYDNDADPHQQNNLIRNPDYRPTADELKARLLVAMGQNEGIAATVYSPLKEEGS